MHQVDILNRTAPFNTFDKIKIQIRIVGYHYFMKSFSIQINASINANAMNETY